MGGSSPTVGEQPSLLAKFISAGLAACIGDVCTFPLDTAKVRLQLQGEGVAVSPGGAMQLQYRGIFGTLVTMSRQEGVLSLYNGLGAGLQRQMGFASVRIGFYDTIKHKYQELFFGKQQAAAAPHNVPTGLRILAGITTGGMAVLFAQPTDVVKVRLQAQKKTEALRYQGVMHAYATIAKEEGIRGLWKGTIPNVTRNAVVNASELVCYDLVKEFLLRNELMSDNMPCHFVSAFGAGFCTTVIASPVDVVKTRFMNAPLGKYRGALNCAMLIFRENGPTAFYKGFMPSFMRLGTWNIIMFVSFEQLKRFAVHMGYVSKSTKQRIEAGAGG